MEGSMFQTLAHVETISSQLPATPGPVISRDTRSFAASHQEDNGIALQDLKSARDNVTTPPRGPSPPTTPPNNELDLESSLPGTPAEPADAVEAQPSLFDPPMNKYRLASCCLMNFLAGFTDSAPGALIPYMETYYDIGYAVVSLIFVGNALGFIIMAPLVEQIRARLGRARALLVSEVSLSVGFLLMALAVPFPAIVCAYFLIGFGYALNISINNVFCANLRDGTTMLGAMHGSYGLGGTIAPLIATSLVSALGGHRWSLFYYITLGFSLFCAGFGFWAFRGYEIESAARGYNRHEQPLTSSSAPSPGGAAATRKLSGIFAALRSRVVLLGALFIFAYQGAEVSISGWAISFLISERGGDPARVGYATAGFWGGITVGRFLLSPLGARGARERPFVFALTAGAAAFQILFWWVPNTASSIASLAIIGLLIGPIYPCAAAVFARNLPREGGLQINGLSVITAFGSSGGAVAPFTTGLLAQAAGTFVLHPVALGLFCVMVGTWWCQPNARKRTE